jgi:iron complex transport system permease protein
LIGLLAAGLGLLIVSVVLATLFGGVPLALREAITGDGPDAKILWKLRLPRVLLGGLVGMALCVSGASLQALLQNPLADPFVLGVSGGAAAGATGALLIAELIHLHPGSGSSSSILAGFLGAILAAWLVRRIASRAGRISSAAALLAGAVLNSLAGALVLLAQLALSPERGQQILLWLAGSIGYQPPGILWASAIAIGGGSLGLIALAGRLRLLALGGEEAAQLGVDVALTVRLTLAGAALVVAAAVGVSGLVGFVGLLVPHLLRLWLGPDQRLLLPASALFGASFLIAADALGRLLFLPTGIEPPVGAITALLGGPLFLWLLRRSLEAET